MSCDDLDSSEVDQDRFWYCVKTQTKREHIAAEHLRTLEGVEVFCPRLRYRKATRRGKIWWVEALFPGYLLARFDLVESERAVTYTQGVRGLVRFGKEVPPVPESFVAALRHEVAHQPNGNGEAGADGTECDTLTVQTSVEAGEDIEVATGPLSGFQGQVVEVLPGKERVKVLLDFLGQPQVIEVDLFSLLLPRKPLP